MAGSSGKNEQLGGGGFHHVAVRVPDFDAALRFYKDVLGFTERVTWGEGDRRAALLDTGDGNYLEVFAGGPAEPKPVGTIEHFALRTSNVDAVIERMRAAGAPVTVEPRDIVLGRGPNAVPARIAFCRGPGGEEIEFFQNELT